LTIFVRAVSSVDSNETGNLLKKLFGGVGCAIVKPLLRNVKVKIDAEQGHVLITKAGKTHKFTFDEIEELVNDNVL